MSTNLEYRAGERQRKAKLNERKGDRSLEWGDVFFVGRTTWKFCSGGDKMRNASGHQCQVKVSGSEKKVNEKMYNISFITKKFLEVSWWSRAKQRQRNVQKKCAARANLLFLLIRPIAVFHHSPALPSPLSITRFFFSVFLLLYIPNLWTWQLI